MMGKNVIIGGMFMDMNVKEMGAQGYDVDGNGQECDVDVKFKSVMLTF